MHLGKWNNSNHNDYAIGEWSYDIGDWNDSTWFDLKAVMRSTSDSVIIDTYIDGKFLGSITDREAPFFTGSVGMRNYNLPAEFKNICVNGCEFAAAADDGSSSGGWIFIGILFGVIFLYCAIGYAINGHKTKKWGNYKDNIPQLTFWKVLPKLVCVGCQVSYEFIRGLMNKQVGGSDKSLMDTADDGIEKEDENL